MDAEAITKEMCRCLDMISKVRDGTIGKANILAVFAPSLETRVIYISIQREPRRTALVGLAGSPS